MLAPEVHLCAAPEARDLLIHIIESTGDTWEEIRHLRKTPLVCMRREIDFDDVNPATRSSVLKTACWMPDAVRT